MRAAEWVLAQPWAITEDALGVILSIAERTNEPPEAVEARMGRPLDNTRETVTRDGVAIIPVVGPISRYADLFSRISGATDIETLAKDFRTAMDDRSVRAVILNMDTPGGTVAGVSEFADQVRQARGQGKPIVAYVGSQAASAGYWIASAADRIVADPTGMLGSIGVIMGMRKPADPKEGQARTIQLVSSQSPRKRPDPETEAGRAQIQATADDLADVFVDAVAANRGVSRDAVLSDFGKGDQLVGSRAVAAGMADSLGSLESTIASLARGEMPCPPSKPKPARKADSPQPRRAAMSEPNADTISAAEAADLRKQLADAQQKAAAEAQARQEAEAQAQQAIADRIEAAADAFVGSVVLGKDGRDAVATPAERQQIKADYLIAARDDHERPVAGQPRARQEAIERAYRSRKPHGLLGERAASDPAAEARALASDPAGEQRAAEADAEGDRIEADARAWAKRMNGGK